VDSDSLEDLDPIAIYHEREMNVRLLHRLGAELTLVRPPPNTNPNASKDHSEEPIYDSPRQPPPLTHMERVPTYENLLFHDQRP